MNNIFSIRLSKREHRVLRLLAEQFHVSRSQVFHYALEEIARAFLGINEWESFDEEARH